jgi:RHS repeat-associated protein
MLDAVGLVNMNGRVYDPLIGRFLSADPIIQTLSLSQALNPYSYVMNMPLSLIDPSGYSWLSKLFHSIGHFLKKWGGMIIGIAFSVIGMPFIGGLLGSAFSTVANGGTFGTFLTGFIVGAIAGAIAGPIGSKISGMLGVTGKTLAARILAGALTGGIAGGLSSVALGGSFGSGFLGGAIGGAASTWATDRFSGHEVRSNSVAERIESKLGRIFARIAQLPGTIVDAGNRIVGKFLGATEETMRSQLLLADATDTEAAALQHEIDEVVVESNKATQHLVREGSLAVLGTIIMGIGFLVVGPTLPFVFVTAGVIMMAGSAVSMGVEIYRIRRLEMKKEQLMMRQAEGSA